MTGERLFLDTFFVQVLTGDSHFRQAGYNALLADTP
jgi:hypothetical protein